MKYNKNSPYEKPPIERPARCAECSYYSIGAVGGTCTANGCRTHTFDFARPEDRPLPMPINCYWWYANNVWDKVGETKAYEYREERLHLMVTWKMLETLKGKDRHAFVDHVHRPGGCGIIDFNVYPEAKPIYEEIKTKEQGR